MPKYIAAIDQGTTSTRCMIFDRSGKVVSFDQKEHQQYYPHPGWVEHDPLEIWGNVKLVINNAIQKAGITPADLAGFGVTNQRETTVLWEKSTGVPVHPAVVWQDTRTDKICNTLAREGGQDRFREKVGLPLATYFSAPKIKWLLENISGVRKKANQGEILFGTIDSWIVWCLTGGPNGGIHITDPTNASRTMLMNLNTLEWDEEILDIFDIPLRILPIINPSSQIFGFAKDIVNGIPVAGILGDQQAALFGQTCFSPGEVKTTYGTGCFMLMNTGNHPVPSSHRLLTTLGYQIGNQSPVYCLEGSIAITGALVQWLRDNLGIIDRSAEVESLARSVPDNGGIYFVPAFSGLFAPYWRSDARGAILGMTRYIHRGHIARAALEATAFQTREILEAMESDSRVKLQSIKVDGGMVANELLMQFQADILDIPVIRPKISETTAMGAAYAAGISTGFWSSTEDLKTIWQEDRKWVPAMDQSNRDRLYQAWKKAVLRTFDWER